MKRNLILDFDRSVLPMPDASVVALNDWQEDVRFGCSKRKLQQLEHRLATVFHTQPLFTFMGSGDFHHVSYLLIKRWSRLNVPIQVVVFDNHPDNMRYPFGIHCGSWVRHVSRLPFVACVHVVGITSSDVEASHVLENYLLPLCSGKVRYWCVQRKLNLLRYLGARGCRSFTSVKVLIGALLDELAATSEPVYLSIDKDVLAPEVVQTNWDQGVMTLQELMQMVRALKTRTIAGDVVGEVSSYRYRSRFKRILSGLDGQPDVAEDELHQWQLQHQWVNRQLMAIMSA